MRLDRLRQVTPAELRWRAAVALRTAAQRAETRLWPPRWDRADLSRVLDRGVQTGNLAGALAREDWPGAHAALAARLRARPARFVLDPASRDVLRAAILDRWPGAAADAAARAARTLDGAHDILGYRGLDFGRPIDWHRDPVHRRRAPLAFWADVPYLDPAAVGDHKVIWEINRHQHWLRLARAAWLTGDPRYAAAIRADLRGWLDANPPLTGINWASMLEIGVRALSWTWALHALLPDAHADDDPWLVDLLVALERQLTHVEHNLSYYFSPNTHLTGEALALYVVGQALPELAASARWAATGRQVLLAEIGRQILPDGGHAERSTHYQRYTLDFYLLALRTARLTGDTGAARAFEDAVARLATFTRHVAGDDGRLPLIGDDDGGMLWPLAGRACHDVRDSLALAAHACGQPALAPWGVMEESVWVGGPALAAIDPSPGPPIAASRAFPDTGYVVLRDGRGGHAVFDAGAHGYMNGGHAHADALAFTLSLAGRPFLIDPGTSTYVADAALRDRLRHSASHNTVTIDGRPSAVPAGPFHWHSRPDARIESWRQNPAFDWIAAAHDGFAPLVHRRRLLRSAAGWFVVDECAGAGRHEAAAHWQFDPSWTVTAAPGALRAVHDDGTRAWLLHEAETVTLAQADEASGLGWCAPVYGTLVPAWTARLTSAADAPFARVTWIGEARPSATPPVLTRLEPRIDAGSAVAAVVEQDRWRDSLLVRTALPTGSSRSVARAFGCASDAAVVHCTSTGAAIDAIDLVEVRAVALDDGRLAIRASALMRDLHIAIAGDSLDLSATAPPSELVIDGTLVRGACVVRVNGRPLPPGDGAASRLVRAADWDAPEVATAAPAITKV